MADNVRYILDKMAPFFKQLEEIEIFTNTEVKSIIKKRTDYEYILKRRQLEASDFCNYLQYEISLDKLHLTRANRLALANSKEKAHELRSVKAAFIRHISYIFERAVRRFSYDMSLWNEYISFLKTKQSNSILNTVLGRALALHPTEERFWLQSAVHELEINNNTHAARVLLQQALRVNKSSKLIWLKYFELELWNAVRVVERQKGLHLDVTQEVVDEGAPLVVFRHAMDALTGVAGTSASSSQTAIDDLLVMHSSCEGVVSSLSDNLEAELKNRFGTNTRLWTHLINLHVNRALHRGYTGNSQSCKKQKRLMNKVTVEQATDYVNAAVTVCIELLTEVGLEHAAFTDDNDDPIPLSIEFLSMSLNSVRDTLRKCAQMVVYAMRNVSTSKSSTASSTPATKRQRLAAIDTTTPSASAGASAGASTEEGEGADHSDSENDNDDDICEATALHTVVQCDVSTKKKLASLKTPLLALLKQLEEYYQAIPALTETLTQTVVHAQYCVASHSLWLFARLIQLPDEVVMTSNTKEGGAAINPISFLDWATKSASIVNGLVADSPVGLCKSEYSHLITEWVDALHLLFMTLTTDPKHGESVMQFCKDIAISAPVLASTSCEPGNQLLLLIIQQAAVTQQNWDVAESYFKFILSKPAVNSSHNNKGLWACKYLQSALACCGEDGFRAAYNWIVKAHHRLPQMFVSVDFHPVFKFALEQELSLRNIETAVAAIVGDDSSPAKKEGRQSDLLAVKAIASTAVTMCPYVDDFVDLLAEIERKLGNHKIANHLLWKKNRAV